MTFAITPVVREIRHAHFFCGGGFGAKGFNRGAARVGNWQAKFRCIGGIDVSPAAIRDFDRHAGVTGTVLDLFSLEQYRAFHGKEPPPHWREATFDDVRRAFRNERPHIVFLSAPCKGFSGLLAESMSKTDRYQALNGLTLRGVWLMLEAWKNDPPELIIFENVPRIANRGRHLLDQIIALLHSYGYAVAETTHDCGELGGLAQTRKRFLLVARHMEKVPPFLYEPVKQRLRGVGEILEKLPMPGDQSVGPMHRMPQLQWKTWVRLAFVEARSDWRSLNKLAIEDGMLRDFALMPERPMYRGSLGVNEWEGKAAATISSRGLPLNGAYAVADPRVDGHEKSSQLGVRGWGQHAPVVTSKMIAGGGPNSVADPRLEGKPLFNNAYRIVPSASGHAVPDPRPPADNGYKHVKYRVTRGDESSGAVIGASTTGNGAFAVADMRIDQARNGAFGVRHANDPSGTVQGEAHPSNGAFAFADPRPAEGDAAAALPAANDRLVAVIRARDGTWHRPFTTYELASLQGLFDPEEQFELDGLSDSAWRERIGNAVPPPAAKAVADEMGRTLLLAWSGQTFQLSNTPIWVRPTVIGLIAATGAFVP